MLARDPLIINKLTDDNIVIKYNNFAIKRFVFIAQIYVINTENNMKVAKSFVFPNIETGYLYLAYLVTLSTDKNK